MPLYKKNLSIFLLVCYASFAFRAFFPLIDYALNVEYISEELCVEKDNPDNSCQGKCYLTKQIQNQIDHSTNSPKVVILKFIKIPHFLISKILNPDLQSQIKNFISYHTSYKQSIKKEPLLPPPKYIG